MSTPLTGRKIKDSYKDLLQVPNGNTGIDGTLRVVEDGEGTASALQISTDAVHIAGALTFAGSLPQLAAMKEPTGFVNRTDSALSWDDGTLTLTITGTFDIYSAGVKYTKTNPTKPIANTTGLHFLYFDTTGTLQTNMTGWVISSANVPVACVLWNGTTGILMDERHGIQMDGMTHEYLHETKGPAFTSGLAGTFAADGSTFSIGAGEWYDEDIEWINLAAYTQCRVYYLDGTTWKWSAAQNGYYTAVSSVPQYNKLTGGSWALEPMGSNKYGIAWFFMSNHSTTPVMVVMGQAEYDNKAAAEAVLASSLVLGTLPASEMLLMYRVVFQRDGAAILWKSTADYRRLGGGQPTNYVATDHGSLGGLADDDHPQYLKITDLTAVHDHSGDAGDGGNLGATAFADQAANVVLAGPATGANAEPTFRALVAADMPAAIFPKRASLRLEESIVSSGTMTAYVDTGVLGCLTIQSGGADATSFTNGCVLLAGTYSLSVIGITDNNRGKVDWYVDGVKVVSGQDWYSSGTVKNVVKTTTSISIATSGWHTITATVNGKNGSSSSYYISISRAWFTPAAD